MEFSAEERKHLQFHNGSGFVWADPLAISRELDHRLGGDIAKTIADTQSDLEPLRYAAMTKFLAAVREVFNLVPFNPADGSGCTDEKAIAAYDCWVAWVDSKKKPEESMPSSSPPAVRGYLQGQSPMPSSSGSI